MFVFIYFTTNEQFKVLKISRQDQVCMNFLIFTKKKSDAMRKFMKLMYEYSLSHT